MDSLRVYLDHAATSWPKLEQVLDAMDDYNRNCGAAAGRGSYRSSQTASGIVESARQKIAQIIGAASASTISFHANGTAALNAAIHGFVLPQSHVITTAIDHNSVLRPLEHLKQTKSVEVTVVPCDSNGLISAEQITSELRENTSLVAVSHASNVTGAIQPIAEIGERLSGHPTKFLCDAAQTFGYVDVNVADLSVDFLATPGHKGGFGPLGTAFLFASSSAQEQLNATIQGGTGSQSERLEMPTSYPGKLEAGNLNVPALAGWLSGLEHLIASGFHQFISHGFSSRLHHELGAIQGVNLFGHPNDLGIVSLSIDGASPVDIAAILDAEFNIETRAGLHCSAMIHQHIGSAPEGTLRISAGHTTTHQEIDQVCDAITAIAAEM